MADELDDLLAMAEEDDGSFVTAAEDLTINRTTATVDESFFSTATHVAGDGDFSDDDEDRNPTPTVDGPEEQRRFTFTEQETKDACAAANSSMEKDVREQLAMESDDSDVEELYEKKSLNDSGKSIAKLLSKSAPPTQMLLSAKAEPTITTQKPAALGIAKFMPEKPAVAAYDKFFGFKIKTPRVSSMTFDSLVDGVSKIRLMTLRHGQEMKDSWVTMGVVVDKGETKKSASGHEYLIWKLHDLKNCQDKPVKVLLFGEACKENWKLQAGSTVALVSAQMADQQQITAKDPLVTLKVAKKSQVIDLGFCATFATCKGTCQSGQRCSNFCNTDISEYCVYHVMSAARQLSSKRGVFNNVSAVAAKRKSFMPSQPAGLMVNNAVNRPLCKSSVVPKGIVNEAGTMKVADGTAFKASGQKTTTKEEEKSQLKAIMTDRTFLLGARNLQRHETLKNKQPDAVVAKQGPASMSTFIQEREKAKQQAAINRAPTLGFGLRAGGEINLGGHSKSRDSEHEAARLRAIAILKNKKGGAVGAGKGVKRTAEDAETSRGTPAKQSRQLGSITNKDELEKLLKQKSIHEKEADKEELTAEQRYFDSVAHKEKVESFTTSCMAMKNVKVITCKRCNYTAQSQSEYCMQQGHAIQRHTAEKRYFKCGGCTKRTTAFGLMPTKPCEHCDANAWERVAMRDERKVVLENEKLQVRGEERKNVNV